MNNCDIQLATVPERDWAAQLIVRSEPWSRSNLSLERARDVCHDPEYLHYIARIDQKPCGAMILDLKGLAGSPYIKWIVVDPDARGRGIGTALIAFAEESVRAHSNHLFLCVSSFNTRAQTLYEKLGFKKVGEIPDYFINGASEFLLHKRLK